MVNLFKKNQVTPIYAVCNGEVVETKEISDPMFAQEMMGKTYAINPSSNDVYSPVDGEIILVSSTLHALGIKTANGIELLIHIGIDTVSLKGKYFECFVSVGDKVTPKTKLISFDYLNVAKLNIDPTIMTIILNKDDFKIEEKTLPNHVEASNNIICLLKK